MKLLIEGKLARDLDAYIEGLCQDRQRVLYRGSDLFYLKDGCSCLSANYNKLKEIFRMVIHSIENFDFADSLLTPRFHIVVTACSAPGQECRVVMEVVSEDDPSSMISLIAAMHYGQPSGVELVSKAGSVKEKVESHGGFIWMAPSSHDSRPGVNAMACQVHIPLSSGECALFYAVNF